MMSANHTELSQVNILSLDLQGVGRSNLLKSALEKSELKQRYPDIPIKSAGIFTPDSGTKTIHPAVVKTAMERHRAEIGDWPVTLLTPQMVTDRTIVVCLCEPELIPSYVAEQSLDILLAPIDDPFGPDIEKKLNTTATYIFYYQWLLSLTLTRKFSEIGVHRDSDNHVLPRHLLNFEPQNIESEYRFSNFLAHALYPSPVYKKS